MSKGNLTQLDNRYLAPVEYGAVLNIVTIKEAMAAAGSTQAAVARACGVSKEAVSNWLSGESQPRPQALLSLSKHLGLSVNQLLVTAENGAEPVVAYRTRLNKEPTPAILEAAQDLGRHLRRLIPYLIQEPAFCPPVLVDPSVESLYIDRCTSLIRQQFDMSPTAVASVDDVIGMHHAIGSILVPVLWGGDRAGHENALHVYLPDSKSSWVVFNLNCRNDDFKFWLAHELGHGYSLHALRGQQGEIFAEKFAAALLFPPQAAEIAYKKLQGNLSTRLSVACTIAEGFGVSPITVVREVDRYAKQSTLPKTGLDGPHLYNHCRKLASSVGTVAGELFGTETPSASEYIEIAAQVFDTPLFDALAKLQADEGASPAYVAAALNIGVVDAIEVCRALNSRSKSSLETEAVA